MSTRKSLIAGAVFGLLAVILGAFGAHWLKQAILHWDLSPDEQAGRLAAWEVGVRYQMYHALALLAVGLLGWLQPGASLRIAGLGFTVGVLIFSGCLYAFVLTGVSALGMIVPLGGLCQIVGWIALLVAACRPLKPSADSGH